MILTEEMIRNLPALSDADEKGAEYVEAHFEEDLQEMLNEFNIAVKEIDKLYSNSQKGTKYDTRIPR